MKLCLVNVNNCINYSQYGPFFFENIKNKDCVIYNDVTDVGKLSGLYDFLVAEYNRNAFTSQEIRLVFVISRDMRSLSPEDREFYAKVNIYRQITSKLSFFSQTDIIYLDRTEDEKEGEAHRKEACICEYMMSSSPEFAEYLPICDEVRSKKELLEKIHSIKDPVFREFASDIFCSIPSELDEKLLRQLEKLYASKCAERLNKIDVYHELIKPNDVADRISKTIKVIYFIKSLFEDIKTPLSDLSNFQVDHEEIKVLVKTYKRRLEKWLEGTYDTMPEEVRSIKKYIKMEKHAEFCGTINQLIDENLSFLESISSRFKKKPKNGADIKKHDDANLKKVDEMDSIVDETFDKLDKIVKYAKDEVVKFAQGQEEHFFDKENSYTTEPAASQSINKIDRKNNEEHLLEKLNRYELFSPPGMTELIRLEQKLEKINEKIHNLLKCKKVYKMKAFLITFIFSFVSVIGIYLGIQAKLIAANKAFLVFFIYAAIIGVGFFAMYGILMYFYKKQIFLLLKKCKKEVMEYLEVCKQMAKDFEENVNTLADYVCYKEFVDKLEEAEKGRDVALSKSEWHKRKVRDILKNINHFNDYINGAQSLEGKEELDFDDFDNDAEHTDFYQMKLFVKGK